MRTHIALYRWKHDTDLTAVEKLLSGIASLATKIPGIIEISTSENDSKYSEGYSHVILVRAENQAVIDAYRHHPEHQAIAAQLDSLEDSSIGVDFTDTL